jgi:hypothetical protein
MEKIQAIRKQQMYSTAIATIGCAHFADGDVVSVRWVWQNEIGTDWYLVEPWGVMYPAHHLTSFVL